MTEAKPHNYVQDIIDKFGNANRMAQVLGVSKTTIYSWRDAWFIPQKYHELIYIFGQTVDPPVEIQDFICFDIELARKRAVALINELEKTSAQSPRAKQ